MKAANNNNYQLRYGRSLLCYAAKISLFFLRNDTDIYLRYCCKKRHVLPPGCNSTKTKYRVEQRKNTENAAFDVENEWMPLVKGTAVPSQLYQTGL